MIEYYQKLLNECIALQKNKELLANMKETLEKMKYNLYFLTGRGREWKHTMRSISWNEFMKGV